MDSQRPVSTLPVPLPGARMDGQVFGMHAGNSSVHEPSALQTEVSDPAIIVVQEK